MTLLISFVVLLAISRVLAGFFELILIKLFKINRTVGIVISMILAFIVYLLPHFLLGSVSELEPNPARRQQIAENEAASFYTGVALMAISCVIWLIVDLAIGRSWASKSTETPTS